MEHLKHKDSFKEIINIFKEGYNTPGKAFVWAKVFNMWSIFALGSIFLIALLISSFLFFKGLHTKQESVDNEAHVLSSHLEDTITFMDIGRRSLEKRQSLLNVLMQSSIEPTSQSSSQTVLEQKLKTLQSLLLSCIEARQMFISALAEAKNPLLNTDLSHL